MDDSEKDISNNLKNISEKELIKRITKSFKKKNSSTKVDIGDDAAILSFDKTNLAISQDILVEGVHFDLSYVPLKHLGYKSVVVNISDVISMSVKPSQVLVSIAVSNRFKIEALEELYEGIKLACSFYGVDLIGGDTTSSNKGLMISVTCIGSTESNKFTLRRGSKEEDLLVVSGDLGSAYMGLQVLEREKQVFLVNPNSKPDLSNYKHIVERQLKPEARNDVIDFFIENKIKPTSMIDISDGLSSELLHICKQSEVGCDLYENKIPLDPQLISTCEEFKLNVTTLALNGGEDYELLMTVSQKDYDKIKGNPNLTVIGYIKEKNTGTNLVLRDNSIVELKSRGWGSKED